MGKVKWAIVLPSQLFVITIFIALNNILLNTLPFKCRNNDFLRNKTLIFTLIKNICKDMLFYESVLIKKQNE